MFGFLAVTSLSAGADTLVKPEQGVLLDRLAVAVSTAEPRAWNWVKVNAGGSVTTKVCRVVVMPVMPEKRALQCNEKKSPVMDGKLYARIGDLMKETKNGSMKYDKGFACGALPHEAVTYRSAADHRVLWTGQTPTPCSPSYFNDSAAAQELKTILDSFVAK